MKKRIVSLIVLASMLAMTACGSAVETMSNSVSDEVAVPVKINVAEVAASVTASVKDCQASAADTVAKIAEEKAKAEAEALAAEEAKNARPSDLCINIARSGQDPWWLDLTKEMRYPVTLTFCGTADHANSLSYSYVSGDSNGISYTYKDFLNLFVQFAEIGYTDYELDTYWCPDPAQTEQFKKDLAEAIPDTEIEVEDSTILADMQAQADAEAAYLAQQEAATQAPVNNASGTMSYADIAQGILAIVNQERVAAGLNELQWSGDLAALAEARVQEATVNYSHVRPDGTTQAAENINRTYGEYNLDEMAQRFMTSWMNSEAHRNNILYANYNYIGIAITEANGRVYGAQEFGF